MADSSKSVRKSEKRRAARRRSRLQIRFWNDDFEATAFTADISDSGLLVETARRVPLGARLHVEVRLGDRSYFTEATVARRQEFPSYAHSLFKPAIGLRFVGLGEALEQLQALQEAEPESQPEVTPATPQRSGDDVPTQTLVRAPGEPPAAVPAAMEAPAIDPSWLRVDLSDAVQLQRVFDTDLSKGGLLVESRDAVELGDVLWVVLLLPPPHADLPVRGQVVSAFSSSKQVGLVIENRKAVETQLREVLAELE